MLIDNVVTVHTEDNIGATAYYQMPWEDPHPVPDVFVHPSSSAGGRVCGSSYPLDGNEFSIIGPIQSISDEALHAAYVYHGELGGYQAPVIGVTAIPNPGWEFVSWSDNATTDPHRPVGTPPDYATPKGSFYYYANFRPKNRYVLNLSTGTDCAGYVTVTTSTGTVGPKKYYAPGEKVAISATPGCCTVFDHWSGTAKNEQAVSIEGAPSPDFIIKFPDTTTEGTKEVTAVAIFKPIPSHQFAVVVTPSEINPLLTQTDLDMSNPTLTNQTAQVLISLEDSQYNLLSTVGVLQNPTVQAVPNSGGHIDAQHTGSRVVGTVGPRIASTDGCSLFTYTYTPSYIGGTEKIKVRFYPQGLNHDYVETEATVNVKVHGLELLPPGPPYELTGAESTPWHPVNHWFVPDVIPKLQNFASDVHTRFPRDPLVKYNDSSLEFGGKFELSHSWQSTGDHAEHRVGRNVDMNSTTLNPDHYAQILNLLRNPPYNADVLEHKKNDPAHPNTKPHWHLTF